MFYLSRRIKFIFFSTLSFFALFLVFRILFIAIFSNQMVGDFSDLVWAFWVGIRFDLRLASLIIFPITLLFIIPIINPMHNPLLKRISKAYLLITMFIVNLFYVFDLGNYSYLDQRIDVSSFKLLENPLIALEMIWETYPVFWIICGLILTVWIFWKGIKFAFQFLNDSQQVIRFWHKTLSFIFASTVLLFSIWGTFRQYRLLWSDAQFSDDPFIVAVALNPILYFNETRAFSFTDYDKKLVLNYYDTISNELGVDEPDKNELNFSRFNKNKMLNDKPNIVIIFLESVGLNRMGRVGNPLNPTPFMDKISNEGIFFDRFYIPMVGTARSVFGLVTGIHDVARIETASSNPKIVEQYSLINSLDGYQKYYLMGGSASWRNIRGLLNKNIPDMKIVEQTDLNYPRLDVWGISDHDLFDAARIKFQSLDKDKPFFAVIQTATNHRPYSIPKNINNFNVLEKNINELNSAGFSSLAQYNAMRLLDHAVGTFIDQVKESSYFENTIFIFFGDHGTSDPAASHMARADFDLKLRSYRVPFFIYAPKILDQPKVNSDVSQLVDIMPTVCGLAGVSYINRTLGRDLLSTSNSVDPLALIVNNKVAKSHIAVIGKEHYLSMQRDGTDMKLHELISNDPLVDVKENYPEIVERYSHHLIGIYETAKYMMYNNQN